MSIALLHYYSLSTLPINLFLVDVEIFYILLFTFLPPSPCPFRSRREFSAEVPGSLLGDPPKWMYFFHKEKLKPCSLLLLVTHHSLTRLRLAVLKRPTLHNQAHINGIRRRRQKERREGRR